LNGTPRLFVYSVGKKQDCKEVHLLSSESHVKPFCQLILTLLNLADFERLSSDLGIWSKRLNDFYLENLPRILGKELAGNRLP
jgi:hypothetical protein